MTFSTSSNMRLLVRDASLSQAAVMLTIGLDVNNTVDKSTLTRFRAAITNNLAAQLDKCEGDVWTVELEADVNPPRPLLAAAFSIRILWAQWFYAISPAGAPVRLTVRDDRTYSSSNSAASAPVPIPMATTRGSTSGYARSASPVPSLGRSSSCSSMRSAASSSTAPTSAPSSAGSSPKNPFAELGNGVLDTVQQQQQQQRRVRRQRGGVKQKQRGIHVDKAKLDVTPYDNGITGVLTGGVMLGRRPRPAGAGFAPQPPHPMMSMTA
jgi:hypothetical protein